MKKSRVAILCIIIAIIFAAGGFFAGYKLGEAKKYKQQETESVKDTEPITETEAETESETESEAETETETKQESTVVISVGDRHITMDEINYYLYTIRDQYVTEYGEEPWGIKLEDGRTVGEAAKEKLLNEIIRTQVLCMHGDEFNVSLTPEGEDTIRRNANDYLNRLGPDVAKGFGLTNEAVQKVYLNNEFANIVYGMLYDKLQNEVKNEAEFKDAAADRIEAEVMARADAVIADWTANTEVKVDEIWNSITVGSAG